MTAIFGSHRQPAAEVATDPVFASQHLFRVLLDALSFPGRRFHLIPHPDASGYAQCPEPYTAAALLTLADHEVSVWVSSHPALDGLESVLTKRLRVAVAPLDSADFVVIHESEATAALAEHLFTGSLDYPDTGATLVILSDDLSSADPTTIEVSGPGIPEAVSVTLGTISGAFLHARTHVVAGYPLGFDMLVIDASGSVMGFPRTTIMTVEGAV